MKCDGAETGVEYPNVVMEMDVVWLTASFLVLFSQSAKCRWTNEDAASPDNRALNTKKNKASGLLVVNINAPACC